ncbi:hypothetical protein A0H81_01929 [Grifola frondosa]|uniref:Uncharacterized protein n=1 Tax=Grifola frondosa TaxID=5627 RepID=A0A1C7MTK6_GRIFR|nr:hypothetical protein A0H81_01929 [Grifola frondosa]
MPDWASPPNSNTPTAGQSRNNHSSLRERDPAGACGIQWCGKPLVEEHTLAQLRGDAAKLKSHRAMRQLLLKYVNRDDWPVADKFGDQLSKDNAKRLRVFADSDDEYFPRWERRMGGW